MGFEFRLMQIGIIGANVCRLSNVFYDNWQSMKKTWFVAPTNGLVGFQGSLASPIFRKCNDGIYMRIELRNN